jgi:hypothetical protein
MADLWKEIHVRALNFTSTNDMDFLTNFAKKIPRFTSGCACREHWLSIVKANPPKFGSNGEYFEWTVNTHNLVNIKLGKPTYTVEQAKSFYS